MNTIRRMYSTTNMMVPDMDIALLSFYMRIHGSRTIREFLDDHGSRVHCPGDYRILEMGEIGMIYENRLRRCVDIPFKESISIGFLNVWREGDCYAFYQAARDMKYYLNDGLVSPTNPDG